MHAAHFDITLYFTENKPLLQAITIFLKRKTKNKKQNNIKTFTCIEAQNLLQYRKPEKNEQPTQPKSTHSQIAMNDCF